MGGVSPVKIQRKKEPMRLFIFLLTFSLILAACGAPATGSPAAPSVKIEPTTAPIESVTEAAFGNSLLAVEWTGRSKGNLLFPLDPATGLALPDYEPIPLGQSYVYAFSPDRRTLAAVTFQNDQATNGNLLLVDLKTWETRPLELRTNGWVSAMVFSPDGKRLAIADGVSTYTLTVFDLEQGVILAQKEDDFLITRLKFTADTESLMLYGILIEKRSTENEVSEGAPQVRLLDAVDLTPLWSVDLKSVRDGIFPKDEKAVVDYSQPGTAMYLSPALVFALDKNALYIVHADSEQLTTVDFDSQKIATVEIQDQLSWFERLLSLTAGTVHAKVADGTSKQAMISPDSQFLYVIGVRNESSQDKYGDWQMNQTPLGLEIIQMSDGSRLEHFETDSTELSISPDGRFLYLHYWTDRGPSTEIFDIAHRQIISRKDGVYAHPALRMNGEPLLVSSYSFAENSHHMGIFQPDDLKALMEWTGSNYIDWITLR